MREVINVEETQESEIIRFPKLKYLELVGLRNLENFYGGGSKLEFPKLKKLILEMLESMRRFAKFENSSFLFHEKIDFPCLEALRVISVNNEVIGVWDKQLLSVTSNPAPMLKQLALGSSAGLRQIPSIVLENLSSLVLVRFEDVDAVFSSSYLGMKKGFAWIYSQLPNLEELKVKDSDSLKELFEKEDDNVIDDALSLFCGQIKTLELNTLPSLSLIPLPLFKNIASLTLFELGWSFLMSAHVLGDVLHQLQFLSIEGCHSLEALVISVDSHFTLPRLKRLRLWNLLSFSGMSYISKNEAALLLPSVESIEIKNCKKLKHFWSGSIVAPRLQDVSLDNCNNMLQFVIGNLEDTIELPSLEKVSFWCCHLIESFSSGSLNAPKLQEVKLMGCPLMECFLPGNPNHDGDLQLPSLEIGYIADCPSLCAFSLRRLVAPKLTQIEYYRKEYPMLPYNDLNHFLQKVNAISDCEDQEDNEDDEDINED
ncbi:uncharacterized protein LOC141637840 [Silene latifolia]|uniref:uncharacterized protein LOC141637840 n=1 Tax=Silene latifolia TaxID=37657 RepID=UPI003D7721FF